MGGSGSKPQEEPTRAPPAISPDLQKVLDDNTYNPGHGAKYPYFLVQLSEAGELPYGESDALVSDAIAAYVARNRVTHIIAQTHGWNTPPDKAVAVPFTEFMGGMQNDHAMPADDDFHPIWVAFIWPALPIEYGRSDDALTRAELLVRSEKEQTGEDTDIAKAAAAAKAAMEKDDPDDADLADAMKVLAEDTKDDDDDDDEDPEDAVARAKETPLSNFIEGFLGVVRPVMRPVENLVFGRLMKRGQRTGAHMADVLGKLMKAVDGKAKVCMMANSLGAHMLVGVLKNPEKLPYKVHTVFFVQGAITRDWFRQGAKFGNIHEQVAGPVVCTFSEKDFMLKNIYGPFHGSAIGFSGTDVGNTMDMKSLDEMKTDPYQLACGAWNNINGNEYIDEGNPVAGAHGDFKEDETTSLYWCAIKTHVDASSYDR